MKNETLLFQSTLFIHLHTNTKLQHNIEMDFQVVVESLF